MPRSVEERLEWLIQKKVEEQVAPARRALPPELVRALEKVAFHFYRHHPLAVAVLRAQAEREEAEQSGRFAIYGVEELAGVESREGGDRV